MIRKSKDNTQPAGGLRTRFYPRTRLGRGLVSIAPWIDGVMLIFFFLLLNSRLLLQPGVLLNIPEAPFRQGSRQDMLAVVLSVPSTARGSREEIVFFDDERFLVDSKEQMAQLKLSFAELRKKHPDTELLVQADRKVSHGTVMALIDAAEDVGIRRVNLATRSP